MTVSALARLRAAVRLAGADSLVRNSVLLMMTTALGAGSGFVFWVLVARLFPPDQVGVATTLLSAVVMLSYFSLVGLNSTLIRRLPTSSQPAALVASAVAVVSVCAVLFSAGYAVLTPVTAPELAVVTRSVPAFALFVGLATGSALNLLTDFVFVAERLARYNLVINGVLMSALKLVLPLAMVGFGALGILAASGVASAVAAAISLVCLRRLLGRPAGISLGVLRTSLRYSAGTYLSSCINLLPQLVIPLVVLGHFGPVTAAAYFVAFQIATLLNSVPYAVGEALFAEGSHAPGRLGALARRSLLMMAAVLLPAVVVVVLAARPILRLFGASYAAQGSTVLVVLVLGSLAVALNSWSGFLLKVTAQLRAMIAAEVTFATITVLGALVASTHGPTWVALAWGAGNLAAAIVAFAALGRRRRSPTATPRRSAGNARRSAGSPSARPLAAARPASPPRRARSTPVARPDPVDQPSVASRREPVGTSPR
jgi:O-antigen/teichoic acid export membrane protein